MIAQECKINDVLSLKFENNETWICINGKNIEKYNDPVPSIELFNKHCIDFKEWFNNDYKIELFPDVSFPSMTISPFFLLEYLYRAKEKKALLVFKDEVKRQILEHRATPGDILNHAFSKEDYLDLFRTSLDREIYDRLFFLTTLSHFYSSISIEDLEKSLNIKYEDINHWEDGIKKKLFLLIFQEKAIADLQRKFNCFCRYKTDPLGIGTTFCGTYGFRKLESLSIKPRMDIFDDDDNFYYNENYGHEIKGLKYLHYLESLTIKHIKFERLSEVEGLQNLLNLKKLELSKNEVESLEGIQSLLFLEELIINYQKLSTIDQLSGLKHLKSLDLSYNQIKNIKILQNLENLEFLQLSYNKIDDYTALINLPRLKTVNLYGNNIPQNKLNEFYDYLKKK